VCLCNHLGDRATEKDGLNHGTNEGNHGKAAMDDLRLLAGRNLCRGHFLQQTTIKTKVTGLTISVVHVEGSKFGSGDSEEDLNIDTPADLADSTKDVCAGVGIAGEVDAVLRRKDTEDGKHAHTPVLDLSPACIFQVGLDIRPVVKLSSNVVRRRCTIRRLQNVGRGDPTERHDFTYKRMGSKPMSPAIDPSSFSGRTKKGTDLDISSAFKETDPARWDCCRYNSKAKNHIRTVRILLQHFSILSTFDIRKNSIINLSVTSSTYH
jgi:hypothetical protein